ncbi:AbrB/MazE/SpoVT family DNA-binding domain-containing protein [Halobellus ordinarius]|uniref:AbrB/MazE/SpoVT family DNA-binding domain-containing protein n=1 Tax=Halobellus ordinarius TaxID=3075120 RepID=UPI0028808E1E|nr:AbrB/MazE/SpoVT family DNA-binding domain-containing protein [Halobellus sp. ZY16]
MSTGREPKTRSATVQESNGCKRVTIPADVAEDVDVEAGDTVLFRPDDSGEIKMRPADDVWPDE